MRPHKEEKNIFLFLFCQLISFLINAYNYHDIIEQNK